MLLFAPDIIYALFLVDHPQNGCNIYMQSLQTHNLVHAIWDFSKLGPKGISTFKLQHGWDQNQMHDTTSRLPLKRFSKHNFKLVNNSRREQVTHSGV